MDFAKIRREYVREPITLEDLDEDPMQVFQTWFDEAFQFFGDETNAMSLATADQEGRPSIRTVLLKGITADGFIFYTNYLSRKGAQLTQNPVAAILFYWPGLDRQIRIEGPVYKVPDQQSQEYFDSRPPGSRISAAASPQSSRITLDELNEKRAILEQTGQVERPPNWGGFEVKGEYFEFWNGRENRFHDRFVYDKRKSAFF